MSSDDSPAAAWDSEYRLGRYLGDSPVAFTRDILAAAQQAHLARGLYIGCGNGRNYLPLRLQTIQRVPPQPGQWSQWEAIWRGTS